MGLSDCIKCWDTPCACGYDYRDYSEERLANFIASSMRYFSIEARERILKNVENKITEERYKSITKT